MNYTITNIYKNMANKFRVRIDHDNGTLYFKFDHYPSEIEIESTVNNYFKILASTLENQE
jgi:uncharacterized protein YegP (UPF0339 family)